MIDRDTIARRMALRSRMGKKEAHSVYKAIKNKKKIPTIKPKIRKRNPEYDKMSIEEWEKKYN